MDSQLAVLLGELSGKIDLILKNQEAHHAENREVARKVSALEHRQSWVAGAAFAVSTVVSMAWAYVTHFTRT